MGDMEYFRCMHFEDKNYFFQILKSDLKKINSTLKNIFYSSDVFVSANLYSQAVSKETFSRFIVYIIIQSQSPDFHVLAGFQKASFYIGILLYTICNAYF